MVLTLFVTEADAAPDPSFLAGAVSAHWCGDDRRLLVYAPADWRVPAGFTRHGLTPLMAIGGASAGEAAPFHYLVWTDVADGWDDELNAWYRDEHLPGLAGVPGAVRARRFAQDGEGPRYLACYDLIAPDVLGSPPWLAVRATGWSSRVRPQFRNTRRWMCATLPVLSNAPQGY
jgi:hypothetical protein